MRRPATRVGGSGAELVKQRRRNEGRSVTSGLKRLVVPGLLLMAAYFAVFGGEYSVFELRDARADVVKEQARLEEARVEIDSLRAELDRLEHDPATIERIAREDYGMIRRGEVLYRFADADSPDTEPSSPGASLQR